MTTPTNDGGTAFPNGPCPMFTDDSQFGERGMTLRDWFAGQALTGFMVHQGWIGYTDTPEHRAHLVSHYGRDAYLVADAMLAARSSPSPGSAQQQKT